MCLYIMDDNIKSIKRLVMKTKFTQLLIIPLFMGFIISASMAQKAVLDYIDPMGYPDIKAGFTIKDSKGKEIRPAAYNWQASDITVTENGVPRPIKAGWPFCADPSQKTFSAILVMDVSNSMQDGIDGSKNPPPGSAKWEIAFRAMQHFVGALDTSLTEVTIIEFGTLARIRMGYSNNKDSLMRSFTEYPFFLLNTNYNAAFIRNKISINNNVVYDSTKSALYVAKFARYKPVIIFLTDGTHNPNGYDPDPFYVGVACNLAQQRNVRIFVVKVGTDILDATSSNNLNSLASVEGSTSDNLLLNVTNGDDLIGFYDHVLAICGQVGYPAPCEVVWESDCKGGGPTQLEFKPGAPYNYDLNVSGAFTIPPNLFPYLDISPNPIPFRNINYTTKDTVTVTLRARNNFVSIPAGGFTSTDGRYKIIDWGGFSLPGILKKDSAITVKLEYSPTDSSYSKSIVEILGSACSGMDINTDGMMNLFCKDVDMGNCTVNASVTGTVTELFCNRGPTSINVTSLNIKTGDANMFDTISTNPPIPCTRDTGQCLEVTFKFKPTSSGGKASRINLVTDGGNFNSNIIGNGIGQPGIASSSPVIFQNTDCKTKTRDTVIYLKNTGPIPLAIDNTVSDLQGADAGEFILVTKPLPDSIPPTDSVPITVTFNPHSAGTKTCSLYVKSNAGNEPDFYVRIEATADSINYEPNSYTVDLGTVCMTGIDTTITLTNVGTKVLNILTATKPSTMTLDKNSWDLNSGSIATIKVNYKPFQDGPVDTVLVFTDDFCNKIKTIQFKGTVYDPKVANLNIDVSSTVGVPYDTTFTITNPSTSVGLAIALPVTAQDPQFTFVSSVPPLPYTIPPGGTMQMTVRYKPTLNQPVMTNLVLTGMPCHDVLIPMSGNPSLATVDIQIDQYSGLIGQVVAIPIYLRSAKNFAASGTTTINTTISFDASLLQQTQGYPETMNGNMRVLTLNTVPVTSTDATQALVDTLKLLVLGGGATSTPLTITNTVSNKNNVQFFEVAGLFTLIEASDTLQTKDYAVYPGQVFDLVIWQSGAKNLSPDFHKSITTEVRANATLLEPVGLSSAIDTVGGVLDRITTLSGIPVNNIAGSTQLTSFKFRAMLGNDTATNIILQNSRPEQGYIKFDTVVCRLTLLGICKDADGTIRLFDPTKNPAALQGINPNPTSGITKVNFSLSEPGNTQIWVADVLGDKVLVIANDNMSPGTKQLSFDSSKLPDGVYFIIMQTPTQFFKQRFNVIK
jgi:hypothetical protein